MNINIKQRLLEIVEKHYKQTDYACLNTMIEQSWRAEKPLQGKKLLVATPIFRNTIAQYWALLEAGAELILGESKDIPHDVFWLKKLNEIGIRSVKVTDSPEDVDVVLDCAGNFSFWTPKFGFSELTRSGVEKFKNCEKPVFLADSGRVKLFETELGTGESYFRAMEMLGYNDWKDKKIVIFGNGKVGRGLLDFALQKKMKIAVVTELKTNPKQQEKVCYFDVNDKINIEKEVLQANYLVMATGVLGAFEKVCSTDVLKKTNAICANMGVEDEFGEAVPKSRVLQDKKPLNFMLDEPTHLRFIDPTFALHAYGAIYVIKNTNLKGLVLPPKDIDDYICEIFEKTRFKKS